MDYYKLDENDCPRLVEMDDYYDWQRSLPEETRTGIGFTLAFNEGAKGNVSTVYLGADHSYDRGQPVLWETMFFPTSGDAETCVRYRSREEALTGHILICKRHNVPTDTTAPPSSPAQ